MSGLFWSLQLSTSICLYCYLSCADEEMWRRMLGVRWWRMRAGFGVAGGVESGIVDEGLVFELCEARRWTTLWQW
jgi:hypothetical protein